MQPYTQTTDFTAAPSCLLSILNYFNKLETTRENEFKIWMKTALLPIRASSIYGLALLSKKYGLNPKIIAGNLDYEYPNYRFKSYKLRELNQAKLTSRLYFKKARKEKIPIEKKELSFEDVKTLLNHKNILLLRLNVGIIRNTKSVSNYVAVFGYGNNKFLINDSRLGKVLIPEDQMREAFETVKIKCKRDNRMIVFENGRY